MRQCWYKARVLEGISRFFMLFEPMKAISGLHETSLVNKALTLKRCGFARAQTLLLNHVDGSFERYDQEITRSLRILDPISKKDLL